MGLRDILGITKKEVIEKANVIGKLFIVEKMFVGKGDDKKFKAFLPGMVLAIEGRLNQDLPDTPKHYTTAKKILAASDGEILVKLITNKGDLSPECVNLIQKRDDQAIDLFVKSCDLGWKIVLIKLDDLPNLREITKSEYESVRAKESKAGMWYCPPKK